MKTNREGKLILWDLKDSFNCNGKGINLLWEALGLQSRNYKETNRFLKDAWAAGSLAKEQLPGTPHAAGRMVFTLFTEALSLLISIQSCVTFPYKESQTFPAKGFLFECGYVFTNTEMTSQPLVSET